MEYEEILHRCFRCGYCTLPSNYTDLNCPAYLVFRFETYSPGGRMWLLRAWLDKKIPISQRFAEIMFCCATCGNCTEHCAFPEFKDYLLMAFTAGKEIFLDTGQVPAPVRDYLTKMQLHGNPYGKPEKKRAVWSEGMGVEEFSDQEYLFFADDVSAYDDRGRELVRCVAGLLRKAGVSFGILAKGINSDGSDVKAMGETLLFEDLAGKNIETFSQKGVQKIITLSPHSFHAFKNDYPPLGGSYQVFHYTQILMSAVDNLKLVEHALKLRITFHDPCYLGRHNWDYESPRTVLRAVPGIQFIEMDRNRKDALCCGGGGGNFFTDMLSGGDDTPARTRVREAKDTGAQVLAVACPQCAIMFEDAIKSENLETSLQVREISEIIAECIER